MCGIAGAMHLEAVETYALRDYVSRMSETLQHRGPDGQGLWVDVERGVALGHRRLAILDLSEAGAQPMLSACGRYALTFNGEIYNWDELRAALDTEAAMAWRGHSDTEVLVEAIARWGIERTLRLASGMFAFALWDRAERALWLARDRAGEKPLFYGWSGSTFLFASELKALRAHPHWRAEIDRASLLEYVRFSYVAAPRSIYAGIRKLMPGTYFRVAHTDPAGTLRPPQSYWSVDEAIAAGAAEAPVDLDTAVARVEELLNTAIKRQLVADVPVGTFLSGGIDSTLVVALARQHSSKRVQTFTIGFEEADYNEAKHAARVAEYLGTEHTEAYVGSREALELVPRIPQLFDEPLGDPSQIPTYFVARLARQAVKVALSGDGGDEQFCGYNQYFLTDSIWRRIRRAPPVARALTGSALRVVATSMGPLPPHRALDRAFKLGVAIDAATQAELFERLSDTWRGRRPVKAAQDVPWWRPEALRLSERDAWLAMSVQDLLTYLPNAILTKVDRAAMAVSLETRIPFLDPAVMQYALSIPHTLQTRDGTRKLVLRRLLAKYVPENLYERPKSGFSVPLAKWLRGPLRAWSEDLLSDRNLRAHDYFDVAVIRRAWAEHVNGYRDWSASLWNVLIFQSWFAQTTDPSRT